MTVRLKFLTIMAFAAGGASASEPGLYSEQSTMLDGVALRRVRDTHEHVVCYVASGRLGGWMSVGISCLREVSP